MASFPITILALAAGVLLLIKVKKDGLGMLYSALSWLVVLLALAFLVHLGHHAYMRRHGMEGWGNKGREMEHGMMMKGHGGNDSACGMACHSDSAGCMSGGSDGCSMHNHCCGMNSCCNMNSCCSMNKSCCDGGDHAGCCADGHDKEKCSDGADKKSCCKK